MQPLTTMLTESPELTVKLQEGKINIVEREQLKNQLQELGFKNVVTRLSLAEKMNTAYERYLFITAETIQKFNEKLRQETLQEDKNSYKYKNLIFISVGDYPEMPPIHVLEKLKVAVLDNCFDRFEIAKIDWITETKDPILFGIINNCSDKFFIAQWDDDVKIMDIISCNTDRVNNV